MCWELARPENSCQAGVEPCGERNHGQPAVPKMHTAPCLTHTSTNYCITLLRLRLQKRVAMENFKNNLVEIAAVRGPLWLGAFF